MKKPRYYNNNANRYLNYRNGARISVGKCNDNAVAEILEGVARGWKFDYTKKETGGRVDPRLEV